MFQDFIDGTALARLLGLSRRQIRRLDEQGKLREFEHGLEIFGRRRFSRSRVLRAIETAIGRTDSPPPGHEVDFLDP